MPIVKDITNIIEKIAPLDMVYPDGYDNIGLLIGSEKAEVSKVLVCLDATEAVIDEAMKLGCSLIITHHPFIFGSISKITINDLLGKKIIKAIASGINIYSAHTNLDFCDKGINEFVANRIGLKNIKPMQPYISDTAGFGRIGELDKVIEIDEFRDIVKKVLSDSNIRIVKGKENTVKKIAVINGGGGGDTKVIDKALELGADCLITADVKHHVALYASELGFTILEPTHYSMEKIYMKYFAEMLEKIANKEKIKVEIILSKIEKSPYI